MLYLLYTLLVFGFLQSILELRKDDLPKWKIKKWLSILYILGFIVGLAVVVIQDSESNRINGLIENIFSSVSKVDSNSKVQIKRLNKSLKETRYLTQVADTLNGQMSTVVKESEYLTNQVVNTNKQLLDHNYYSKKFMEDVSYPLIPMKVEVGYSFVISRASLRKNSLLLDSFISNRRLLDASDLDNNTKNYLNANLAIFFHKYILLKGSRINDSEKEIFADLNHSLSQLFSISYSLADSNVTFSIWRRITDVDIKNADFSQIKGIKELKGREMRFVINMPEAISVCNLYIDIRTGIPFRSVMQFELKQSQSLNGYHEFSQVITDANYQGRYESN